MRHPESPLTWKTLEKWIRRLVFVLWLPALFGFVYLAFLDSRPDDFFDSSNDSSGRIIQGITCPSLMVKDKPSPLEVEPHTMVPNTESTATFTIDAPDFDFVRGDTIRIKEGSSPSSFISPSWIVYPNQTGRQRITISATEDNGLSNAVTCEVIVISFLGWNLDTMYNVTIAIVGLGIIFGLHSRIQRLKQKAALKEEAG